MKASGTSRSAAALRIAAKVSIILFKVASAAFAIATPLLGVWLVSSLAAYKNGPIWACTLLGLLLFPLAPFGWDWLATWLRNRKNRDRRRILKLWDRLILRTLAINLLFLGSVLAFTTQSSFRALQTRGDWMLDGRQGPVANRVRGCLFTIADRLEWLYQGARENPYEKYDDGSAREADPEPNPIPIPEPEELPPEPDSEAGKDQDPDSVRKPEEVRRSWPMANTIHPIVRALPPTVEIDYRTVALHIGKHEDDPYLRLKALHDYVTDRVVYDVEALATMEFPPQDADSVFRTRKAVCAGYSKLLAAMAREIEIEMVYVVGDARTRGDNVDGLGHAWNAVQIEGRWYLIDATWDAGSVSRDGFEKQYQSDFLLTPPEIFGLSHFPDDDRWQLREAPISRGEFMRQPMMMPAFYRQGFRLVEPTRSQISVAGDVRLSVHNPRELYMLARVIPKGKSDGPRCDVHRDEVTKIHCKLPGKGRYELRLYGSAKKYGSYPFVGQIEVNGE